MNCWHGFGKQTAARASVVSCRAYHSAPLTKATSIKTTRKLCLCSYVLNKKTKLKQLLLQGISVRKRSFFLISNYYNYFSAFIVPSI